MRKLFSKLGNIPTLIVVGVLTVAPMIAYEVDAVMKGNFDYFALDICTAALYAALAIFAILKNKTAVLGLFTILLGVYLIGSTNGGIFDIIDGVKTINNSQLNLGIIRVISGAVNVFFVLGVIVFVIGKYFLTGKKTILINIMLICFCLTIIGNITAVIMYFVEGVYTNTDGSFRVFPMIYNLSQIFGPLLFLCSGSIAESLDK